MTPSNLRSVPEAVKLFRDAALRKAQAPNPAEDHKCHRHMKAAFQFLQAQGAKGRNAFDQMLYDDSPEIAQWVAAQLLSEGRSEAIPILCTHQRMGGLFAFEAEMVMREFQAGRLGSPFN
jgi:hypothetical protein